ncbi:MAG: hypothetical protein EBU90_25370 [Proteobacteria bacterium]|nr:hypothetical protein [Pseudomonadota bacterium]
MTRTDIKLINEAAEPDRHMIYINLHVHKYRQEQGRVADISFGNIPWDAPRSSKHNLTTMYIYHTGKMNRRATHDTVWHADIEEVLYYKKKIAAAAWLGWVDNQVDQLCKHGRAQPWDDPAGVHSAVMKQLSTILAPYVDNPDDVFYVLGNEKYAYGVTSSLVGIVRDQRYRQAQRELGQQVGDEDVLGIKDLFNEL